jgi:hypothetical protein
MGDYLLNAALPAMTSIIKRSNMLLGRKRAAFMKKIRTRWAGSRRKNNSKFYLSEK